MRYLTLILVLASAPLFALEEGPAANAVTVTSGDLELDGALYPTPRSMKLGEKAWKLPAPIIVVARDPDPRVLAALADALGLEQPPSIAETLPAAGAAILLGGPERNPHAQAALDAAKLDWNPAAWGRAHEQGYAISIARDGERLRILLAGASPAGDFHAVQTLRQLLARDDAGARWLREAAVLDWPAITLRGIKGLEAEYLAVGVPLKLNFGWSYSGFVTDASKLAEKAKLAARYRDAFAKVAVSVNPGGRLADGFAPANKEKAKTVELTTERQPDATALDLEDEAPPPRSDPGAAPSTLMLEGLAKTYAAWATAGAELFVLSFDDQPVRLHPSYQKDWPDYWAAHAALLKAMVASLPDGAPKYLCPHEYYGLDVSAEKTVAGAKAAGFPNGLRLCWTGRGVVTHGLKRSDAESYGRAFGLPAAFYYYNWPITAPNTRAETGPMPPADPALAELLDVWMICSNHDRASVLALLSALDWSWNPEAYDPARSTKLAAREWARHYGGAGAYAPLYELMEWTRTHDSRQIVPDQALKSPDELAQLVAAEEAYFAARLPAFKQHLTDTKLATEIEKAFLARMKKFKGIVENQKHLRTGKAARRAGDIVLDGSFGEDAWKTAPELKDFIAKGSFETPADPQTSARVLYDETHLYVALEMSEPDLKTAKPYTEKTGWKIQHGDFVQLCLDHTGEKEKMGFACTTLHGQASMYEFGHKWMRGFEVAVARGERSWRAEFKLPLDAVPVEYRPAPGRLWGFNVIRRRVAAGANTWSSWSPFPSTDDKFKAAYCGTLVFD